MQTWEIVFNNDDDYNIHYLFEGSWPELLEEIENLRLHGAHGINAHCVKDENGEAW